ncbi:MAG: UDP-N-acetylglucosamine 4,6-dehydratase (inverting) [Sphingomonadales bacterium]
MTALLKGTGLRPFRDPMPDLEGLSVLVTGGTGSFGQAFVKHVLAEHNPRRLIVYSRDELKQYEMSQLFPQDRYPCMRYFLGDVRDFDRLELAFHGVDIVVHAAALKHVPAAEYNPMECINTNVRGAENVVRASIRAGVKKVIALSTDKAANPINLYGASKLASDKIFIAANGLAGASGTRFAVARYGNVMGSRGSVLPFFLRLIGEGVTSLPITDPRMTRFWITLDQGVSFILSSLGKMIGGEIFVPRIPSMRIVDLARALAPELDHHIVGIRPGEKLHEVLIPADDSRFALLDGDRYVLWSMLDPAVADYYLARGASRVDDDFHYTSDTNTEWLDSESVFRMIA